MKTGDVKKWTWQKNIFYDRYIRSFLNQSLGLRNNLSTKFSTSILKYDIIIVECHEHSGRFLIYGDNTISTNDSLEQIDYFFNDDNGFGSYLYETMYNEKEDEDTMTSTYSSSRTVRTDGISGFSIDDSLGTNNFGYISSNTTDFCHCPTGTISTIRIDEKVDKNDFDDAVNYLYSEVTALRNRCDDLENSQYVTNSLANQSYADCQELKDGMTRFGNQAQEMNEALTKFADKVVKKENAKEKENRIMKGFNIEFGSCENDNIRMSMYGIAIKNKVGEWVSYDADQHEIVNVDIINFEGGNKLMFKMPVAMTQVKAGDVIIHNRIPMFVMASDTAGTFKVVDPHSGEVKDIIPTTNMFGFNFVTKVVSIMEMSGMAPTKEQPFGNLLPLMMMSEGGDIDPMMMMLLMNQQGEGAMDFTKNPMMMYFMMKDKDIDPMMFMMMGMMNK